MTGILCINKPKGITSFGVCAKIRGITGEKKCGHTGTLDPMAEGVLPVMLGGATRFLDFFPESDKAYRASFMLGKTTDTLDITGTVTAEFEVTVGKTEVEAALSDFRGKIKQLPPMYSAISVNGERLYELARKGIEIERAEREVEIKRLELVEEKNGEYIIDVLCSKGTYIRTLIDDIGRELGCGAVMTALTRTAAMGFTLDDCVTIDELQEKKDSGISVADTLIPLDKALGAYRTISVTAPQGTRFKNGGALDLGRIKTRLEQNEICRVYSGDDFLGLGQASGEELKINRIFIEK